MDTISPDILLRAWATRAAWYEAGGELARARYCLLMLESFVGGWPPDLVPLGPPPPVRRRGRE